MRGDSAVRDSLRAVLADDTFARKFEVKEVAAEGGMGRVHRAIDRETGRPIAIKVLLEANTVESRFTLEAEMLERLDHAAVVAYVGHGVTASGEAYLAMAWLDGETLAARIERGSISIADTLEIGIRIASALVHAHGHGIVHRDLKPSNVMLVGGSPANATLIDFGVAKDTQVSHGLTGTGQMIGTPGYMAPEQATGSSASSAMDLFGLGAMLYACVAGQPPFDGKQTMEVLAQLLLRDPTPLHQLRPETPDRLARLIHALLEKEPAKRTASAAEVEAELRAISAAVSRGDTLVLAGGGRRRRIAIGAGIAGVLVVGVVALVLRRDDSAVGPTQADVSSRTAARKHDCEAAGGDACARACELDDALACRAHGRAKYLAAKDPDAQAEAIEVLSKSCTLGDPAACSLGGTWMRRHVAHGDRRYTRDSWVVLFEKGCALEAGSACLQLAEHLLSESPTSVDRAVALYERGCTTSPIACAHAADLLLHRGQTGDGERAQKHLTEACARGLARACR